MYSDSAGAYENGVAKEEMPPLDLVRRGALLASSPPARTPLRLSHTRLWNEARARCAVGRAGAVGAIRTLETRRRQADI